MLKTSQTHRYRKIRMFINAFSREGAQAAAAAAAAANSISSINNGQLANVIAIDVNVLQ